MQQQTKKVHPANFPLEIRGNVSGKHFCIGRKHHPSSFSFLHTQKIVADWQLTLQTSTVDSEVACSVV